MNTSKLLLKNQKVSSLGVAILLLMGLLSFAGADAASAAQLLSNAGTGTTVTNPVGVPVQLIGFEFTVGSDPLLVTQLGTFDRMQNGTAFAQQVHLWTVAGDLVTEATVPAGTVAPLLGQFRYVDLLEPVLLMPGQSYMLGTANTEAYFSNAAANILPFVAPEVTYVQGRRNMNGADLAGFIPDIGARIGPNLTFSVVPEPSTFALAALGIAFTVALRRRMNATS